MRWFSTLIVLGVTYGTTVAQENEGEKLFRDMEKQIGRAQIIQIRFDLDMTDSQGQKAQVNGSLKLGQDDKFRLDAAGKVFGQTVKFGSVSDGSSVKHFGTPEPPKEAQISPKGVGDYYRTVLPREGFFLSSLHVDKRDKRTADMVTVSDFKLLGKEKIGERNTQLISYTLGVKGAKEKHSMKLWLAPDTHLPVKLSVTGGKSDWKELTETYSEFTIGGELAAQVFELPK